jgi:DHA1 family bicyclomycin/chloramphenicol resistance-like MFS transporter
MRPPWRLLTLLVAMSTIGPLSLNIIVPAVPGLTRVLATDPATIQLTISLYLVGLAFAQLALGPLSDHFGRRPVLLAGLAITALTSVAAAAATSVTWLIAARTAQAFGASTGLVIGRAMVRDLYDRERAATMIAWITMAMVIAPMLAPLIGGILDTAFGWESIFIFIALCSVAVLVWAAIALPETRPMRAEGVARTPLRVEARMLARSPAFFGYVAAAAIGSAPFFTFLGGGPHAVVTIMGRSSAEYGIWFALSSVGYMGGNYMVGKLSLQHGIDKLIWWGIWFTIGGAALAALLSWLAPHGGPAIIFIPQLIMSLGNGLLLPNAIAGAVSVRPQAAGTASGLTGFAQMAIGAAAAQIASHVLVDAATPLPMSIVMLIFAVATAVAFGLLVRSGARH